MKIVREVLVARRTSRDEAVSGPSRPPSSHASEFGSAVYKENPTGSISLLVLHIPISDYKNVRKSFLMESFRNSMFGLRVYEGFSNIAIMLFHWEIL